MEAQLSAAVDGHAEAEGGGTASRCNEASCSSVAEVERLQVQAALAHAMDVVVYTGTGAIGQMVIGYPPPSLCARTHMHAHAHMHAHRRR